MAPSDGADDPGTHPATVDDILEEISPGELRAFVSEECTRNPGTRDRFFARFGDAAGRPVKEYREEVEALFEEHTTDYPVVTGPIDFSEVFEIATEYRERERYRAAATVYRGIFEGIDDNYKLIEGAYDHFARRFQTALDGYVACVLKADLSPKEFESYAGVIDERASTGKGSDMHRQQFGRALDELEDEW
ncbi:MAG: hypothetical protein ABEH66_05245 [Halobacteriales archaeon]